MKPLCVWCGHHTYSPVRVCHSCRNVERERGYSPEDALMGGRWVLGPRRVLVWEPGAVA